MSSLLDDHITNIIDQRIASRQESDYAFDFTDAEIAEANRVIQQAAKYEPDFSLAMSRELHARFLCNTCLAHGFEAETVVYDGIRYHSGCAGLICEVPF